MAALLGPVSSVCTTYRVHVRAIVGYCNSVRNEYEFDHRRFSWRFGSMNGGHSDATMLNVEEALTAKQYHGFRVCTSILSHDSLFPFRIPPMYIQHAPPKHILHRAHFPTLSGALL